MHLFVCLSFSFLCSRAEYQNKWVISNKGGVFVDLWELINVESIINTKAQDQTDEKNRNEMNHLVWFEQLNAWIAENAVLVLLWHSPDTDKTAHIFRTNAVECRLSVVSATRRKWLIKRLIERSIIGHLVFLVLFCERRKTFWKIWMIIIFIW